MSIVTIKELLDAGVHFGHKVSRWNPKMRPYIIKQKNKIHIINLKETVKALAEARHYLTEMAALGKTILFVGTKRSAQSVVESEAKRCGMPFINYRWIGGYLTNREIILNNLSKYHEMCAFETSEEYNAYSKKAISRHMRKKEKIHKNFAGTMDLIQMPDILLIIGLYDESIAIAEAEKLGIPIIAIADTDANPEKVDCCIPANDESFRAIRLILGKIVDGINEGKNRYNTANANAASFGPDETEESKETSEAAADEAITEDEEQGKEESA